MDTSSSFTVFLINCICQSKHEYDILKYKSFFPLAQ